MSVVTSSQTFVRSSLPGGWFQSRPTWAPRGRRAHKNRRSSYAGTITTKKTQHSIGIGIAMLILVHQPFCKHNMSELYATASNRSLRWVDQVFFPTSMNYWQIWTFIKFPEKKNSFSYWSYCNVHMSRTGRLVWILSSLPVPLICVPVMLLVILMPWYRSWRFSIYRSTQPFCGSSYKFTRASICRPLLPRLLLCGLRKR